VNWINLGGTCEYGNGPLSFVGSCENVWTNVTAMSCRGKTVLCGVSYLKF
jgi:hypothetical protein